MRSGVEFPAGVRGERRSAVPTDLVAAVLVMAVADVVVLVAPGGAAGVAAAATLLFLLPGYAVVAAAYPGDAPDGDDDRSGVGLGERLALSVGVSVAGLVFVGLAAYQLAALGGGTPSTTTTLAVVNAVVVGAAAVAAVRRLRRPPSDRFAPSVRASYARARAAAFGGTRRDQLLNVLLAVAVLLGTGMLGYAVATPPDAERYTSASLLTEGEDGDLVASGYPDQIGPGESAELVLRLGNHEGTDVTYEVVVRLEQVDAAGGGATVTGADELDRFQVDVAAGETRTVPHEVAPGTTGEDLRLSYYVYRGEAPAEPSPSSAARHLYVWVSVG